MNKEYGPEAYLINHWYEEGTLGLGKGAEASALATNIDMMPYIPKKTLQKYV